MQWSQGARTPDLLAASQALSQLSYGPVELVIRRVGYRVLLVVSRRGEPSRYFPLPDVRDRHQVAAAVSAQYAAIASTSDAS